MLDRSKKSPVRRDLAPLTTSRRLRFESFESRQMAAADIAYNAANHHITIEGTPEADTAYISFDTRGTAGEHDDLVIAKISQPGVEGSEVIREFGRYQGGSPVEFLIKFNAGDGDDAFFNGTPYSAKVIGGSGDDDLNGGSGADFIDGGEGNDKINGGAGNDFLIGGDGDDEIFGGDGDDMLFGGAGRNSLDGGAGNNQVHDGQGDFVPFAGGGQNLLFHPNELQSRPGTLSNDLIGVQDNRIASGNIGETNDSSLETSNGISVDRNSTDSNANLVANGAANYRARELAFADSDWKNDLTIGTGVEHQAVSRLRELAAANMLVDYSPFSELNNGRYDWDDIWDWLFAEFDPFGMMLSSD